MHRLGFNEVPEGGREAEVLINHAKVCFVVEERLSNPLCLCFTGGTTQASHCLISSQQQVNAFRKLHTR